MNDDELEARLAALRPAELPELLHARLQDAPRHALRRWLLPLAGLAAAATWVIFAALDRPAPGSVRTASPADFRVFIPIEQESTLVAIEDLGVIEPQADLPVRLVRTTWLDDITYRGDDGSTTLRRQEPRAEIHPIILHPL